ncbi:MAG: hypothetical protein U1E65_04075 [Myxococcota bacterium]
MDDPFAPPTTDVSTVEASDPADLMRRRLTLRQESAVRGVGLTYFVLGVSISAFAASSLPKVIYQAALPGVFLRILAGAGLVGLGAGLRRLDPWSRWPAIAASSALGLLTWPWGAPYHAIVLFLLLSPHGRSVLSRDHAALIARTPEIKHPPPSRRVIGLFIALAIYLGYVVVLRVRG